MTIPYVYKMVNTKTGEYYIGCRYTEGCRPSESFDVYASSSRLVKNKIKSNPNDWRKDILMTSDTEGVLLEEGYLIKQHRENELCLNGLRSDGTRYKKIRIIPHLLPVNEEAIVEIMKQLGKKIQETRKTKGITAEELAKAVNSSRGRIQRIEKGIPTMEIAAVFRVLQVLDLKPLMVK